MDYPPYPHNHYSSKSLDNGSDEYPTEPTRSYEPEWQPKFTQQPSYSSSLDPLPSTSSKQRTFWQSIIPDSVPCRLYVVVVVLQTLVDLAIEGDLVLRFNQAAKLDLTLNESSARRLPVYFSIFCFAHIFQLVLAIDAVWTRNTLQFFFLTAFNLIFLIYAIVQIFEIRGAWPQTGSGVTHGISSIPINVLTAVTPCVIAVSELAYIFLGWSIWREFGWKVYKLLGADRRIKRMYMHYQILACIMKFDVFFWGGFSIQLIWMVLQPTNIEYYVTVAALPASLIVLVGGHLGARYENKPLMYTFMISCVGASGYFAFKLFRIIQQRSDATIQPVFKTLISFAIIAMLFLLATFTWSCIVVSNFGAGLKHHMSKNKTYNGRPVSQRGRIQHYESDGFPVHSGKAKRMSID